MNKAKKPTFREESWSATRTPFTSMIGSKGTTAKVMNAGTTQRAGAIR